MHMIHFAILLDYYNKAKISKSGISKSAVIDPSAKI